MHIIGVIVEGLRRRHCRRLAVATQIDAQYREIPPQFGSYRLEEREIGPNRVQQHDMRAGALDLVMERWSHHVIIPAKRDGRRRPALNLGWRALRQQSAHNPGRKR
jgi:hypothetical protein